MSQLFDNTPADHAGFAHVALEQGIDVGPGGLTYAIPVSMSDVSVGDRVLVPLGRGNKIVTGYVTQIAQTCDYAKKIKVIHARDPHSVSLTPDLIALAQWMANYYCCPLGMVFLTMLPAAVKRGTGTVSELWVTLKPHEEISADASTGAVAVPAIKLTKLQKAVLEVAQRHALSDEPWVEIKDLAHMAGAHSISPVKQLIEKNLLIAQRQPAIRAGEDQMLANVEPSPLKLTLNTSQQKALDQLAAKVHEGFSVQLLHGVTGSGKTEVYLRIIQHLLEHAKQTSSSQAPGGAIVLVPEIALTPQTVARFHGRFDGVAVLHSGLTASQRHEQWRRIRDGKARIVVGARSAIFAPLTNVSVIIVDEEHEQSYKQDQLPRYHARDVAIKRGQLLKIPVVLGSATPSLESYYNAIAGEKDEQAGDSDTNGSARRSRFNLLRLPERVAGFKLPKVVIVDLVEERKHRRGVHLISRTLETQLEYTLRQKAQAMFLLNRRGYANYIACPDHRCGWMMTCEFCDATMVYHKDHQLPAGGVVRCHHCTAEQLLPRLCPLCSKKVTVFGLGTQRVEEEISRKFPQARMLRMDSDTMRTGRDYHQSLDLFRRGEVDVLVGTQMIAKGLDFPNVRLVGVISGDTALHMPDFRAGERTFQLIAQVAGRAGRSEMPGLVVVQSFSPNDEAITMASRHDYEAFATRELALREKMGLPPISRMARIVVRDTDHVACFEQAKKLANHLTLFNEQLGTGVRLRGPAPCPIARVAGYHRQQIELIAPPPDAASKLQRLMTALRNAKLLLSDARTAVDVDPVSLL